MLGISIFFTASSQMKWESISQIVAPDGFYLKDIHFITKDIGYITNAFKVWHTYDGGKNWQVIFDNLDMYRSVRDIYFIDNGVGWILNNNDLLKTVDNGKNWSKVVGYISFKGSYQQIFFKDILNGIITTGKGVLHTSDGGVNWNYNPTLCTSHGNTDRENSLDIISINPETGIGYGVAEDFIFKTSDFGVTWIEDFEVPDESPNLEYKKIKDIHYNGFTALSLKYSFENTYSGSLYKRYDNMWVEVPHFWINNTAVCGFSTNNFILATKSSYGNSVYAMHIIIDAQNREDKFDIGQDIIRKFCLVDNVIYAIGSKTLYRFGSDNTVGNTSLPYSDILVYSKGSTLYFQHNNQNDRLLKIYNINGQCLLSQKINSKQTQITHNLSPGIYIATFNGNNKKYTTKFTVSTY